MNAGLKVYSTETNLSLVHIENKARIALATNVKALSQLTRHQRAIAYQGTLGDNMIQRSIHECRLIARLAGNAKLS